mmetsp:Transcript_31284/g.65597  ORF Transcript_31284/g.65597 Transcript_31284/m.65597 type:complete len:128 (+) Transcript_31284:1397-1780(+)
MLRPWPPLEPPEAAARAPWLPQRNDTFHHTSEKRWRRKRPTSSEKLVSLLRAVTPPSVIGRRLVMWCGVMWCGVVSRIVLSFLVLHLAPDITQRITITCVVLVRQRRFRCYFASPYTYPRLLAIHFT